MLKFSILIFFSMIQSMPAFIPPDHILVSEDLKPLVFNEQNLKDQLKQVSLIFQNVYSTSFPEIFSFSGAL